MMVRKCLQKNFIESEDDGQYVLQLAARISKLKRNLYEDFQFIELKEVFKLNYFKNNAVEFGELFQETWDNGEDRNGNVMYSIFIKTNDSNRIQPDSLRKESIMFVKKVKLFLLETGNEQI